MKHLFLLFFLTISYNLLAQNTMQLIRANSIDVAISDDGILDKNAWVLSPETKPDIYVAERSSQPKWVVFYTDIDSIKVRVYPETRFNFIILLNNKDTCYTQIAGSKIIKNTLIESKNEHDTIPFELTKYHAIHVKAIVNNKDTIDLHLDLGSLDFSIIKNAFTNVISTIKIGNLIWEKPNVKLANTVSVGMQGRFGWRAFDDKIVEINYDKKMIIVHKDLPGYYEHYTKSKINFIQSLFCVEAAFHIINHNYPGNFLFDTGSNLAIVVDSVWAATSSFPDSLKVLKKSSFSDGSGRIYQTSLVVVPSLTINNNSLKNIPTSKLGYSSPVGFQMNYFGNDLLKRFNMLIDLKNDEIYLKSNNLSELPYTTN